MCGGKSSRMGKDKSLLNYHGKAQCYHVYEILQHFCNETFISCNPSQTAFIDKKYKTIEDLTKYNDAGPVTGVLTAFSHFPQQPILVIGCDYPFLSETEISHFLLNISAGAMASAFYDDQNQCYQPVLAWYSAAAAPLILDMFQKKQRSLQQFLKMANAEKYYPLNRASMMSVDAREASEEAVRLIANNNH
ncbi:MAG: molybdenum cofactor guanylyltransferase [Flavitalea sp.]